MKNAVIPVHTTEFIQPGKAKVIRLQPPEDPGKKDTEGEKNTARRCLQNRIIGPVFKPRKHEFL